MQPQAGLLAIKFLNWPEYYDLASADAYLFSDITTEAAAQAMLACVQKIAGVTGVSLVDGTAAAGPFSLVGPPNFRMWVIQGTSPGGNLFAPYAATLIDSKPAVQPGQTAQLVFQEFPQEQYANVVWQVTGTPTPPAPAVTTAKSGLGPFNDASQATATQ